MTQRLLDPRMFDTSQALGAHDGSALTSLPATWNLISKQDFSAVASIEWTGLTSYEMYHMIGTARHSSAGSKLQILMSNDNGSTYLTTGSYQQHAVGINRTGTTTNSAGANVNEGTLHSSGEGGSTYNTGFHAIITNTTATSGSAQVMFVSAGNIIGQAGSFVVPNVGPNDFDAFRLGVSAGNFTGTAALYGAVSV